jgi:hypothetical protein
LYCDCFIWCVSCTVVVLTGYVMYGCVCVCVGCVMCACFDKCVSVFMVCVLVFIVFCNVCTVFLYCIIYLYLFFFVLLLLSANSILVSSSSSSSSNFSGLVVSMLSSGTQVHRYKPSRSRRIFQAKKSSACLPSEGK